MIKTLFSFFAGLALCIPAYSQVYQSQYPVVCGDANQMFLTAQKEFGEQPDMIWEDTNGLYVMFTNEESLTVFIIPHAAKDTACVIATGGKLEYINRKGNT